MGRGGSAEGKEEDNVRALGISITTTHTDKHMYYTATFGRGVCVLC